MNPSWWSHHNPKIMIKHLSNHTIKHKSPSRHPKHIIRRKLPDALLFVIIKHLISHIIKNEKPDFLKAVQAYLMKPLANPSPANIGSIHHLFWAATVKTIQLPLTNSLFLLSLLSFLSSCIFSLLLLLLLLVLLLLLSLWPWFALSQYLITSLLFLPLF